MARTNTSRRKILDTGATVFAENGYWNTSMDDIAAAAGVAKGTLYYNFPNKSDLFVSVIQDGMQELKGTWAREIDAGGDEKAIFMAFIKLHVDVFVDYGEIAGIFFAESFRGLDAPARARIQEIREDYLIYLDEMLAEGIRIGLFHAMDTRFTAYVVLNAIYAACRRYRETGDQRDRGFLCTFLYDTIVNGIGGRS